MVMYRLFLIPPPLEIGQILGRAIEFMKRKQRRKPRQRVRREPVETYIEPATDIGLPFKEIIQVLAPRKGRFFGGLPRPLVFKERK